MPMLLATVRAGADIAASSDRNVYFLSIACCIRLAMDETPRNFAPQPCGFMYWS